MSRVIPFPSKADPLEQALLESINRFDASLKMRATPAAIEFDVPIAALAHALAKAGLAFTVKSGVIVIHKMSRTP